MTTPNPIPPGRYDRQIVYEHFGPAGQKKLAAATVVIIGVGGLGSALAELLCRAGVGRIRIVDGDRVALNNLHRQHLYTEADAAAKTPKVAAATEHLRAINSHVEIDPVDGWMDRGNVCELIDGMDLVLDGTDNWPARFLLNDACVKMSIPWIYAGVVGGEAMTMNIIPGETPCLRCIYDSPPPPCTERTCRSVGVLGPAVQMISGLQAFEAIKILTGRADMASRNLLCFDLWTGRIRQIDVATGNDDHQCQCCNLLQFDHLDP